MNEQRFLDKLNVFVGFTQQLAQLSTCSKRKVGAIIIPTDFSNVLAIGYNGPSAGQPPASCACLHDGKGCLHAEVNALLKLRRSQDSLIMIASCMPCITCAGYIVNSKQIGLFMFVDETSDQTGLWLLGASGIHWCNVFSSASFKYWKSLCPPKPQRFVPPSCP